MVSKLSPTLAAILVVALLLVSLESGHCNERRRRRQQHQTSTSTSTTTTTTTKPDEPKGEEVDGDGEETGVGGDDGEGASRADNAALSVSPPPWMVPIWTTARKKIIHKLPVSMLGVGIRFKNLTFLFPSRFRCDLNKPPEGDSTKAIKSSHCVPFQFPPPTELKRNMEDVWMCREWSNFAVEEVPDKSQVAASPFTLVRLKLIRNELVYDKSILNEFELPKLQTDPNYQPKDCYLYRWRPVQYPSKIFRDESFPISNDFKFHMDKLEQLSGRTFGFSDHAYIAYDSHTDLGAPIVCEGKLTFLTYGPWFKRLSMFPEVLSVANLAADLEPLTK